MTHCCWLSWPSAAEGVKRPPAGGSRDVYPVLWERERERTRGCGAETEEFETYGSNSETPADPRLFTSPTGRLSNCTHPLVLEHGGFRCDPSPCRGFPLKSSIHFFCEPGYHINNKVRVSRCRHGRWQPPIPACIPNRGERSRGAVWQVVDFLCRLWPLKASSVDSSVNQWWRSPLTDVRIRFVFHLRCITFILDPGIPFFSCTS